MNKIVYRHLKPNGEVFYIGIGKTKSRAYSKYKRNPHWHNTVNKYGYEVQILKSNLSWEEACELECILIEHYGRKDLGLGPLVNMTDGGDGTVGFKHSEEAKQKIGKASKGKKHTEEAKANMSKAQSGRFVSEEHRLKLSEAKKGFKASEETKLKMSKAKSGEKHPTAKKVINTETGVIYGTITEASKKENIKNTTLWAMLNGKNPNKTNLKFI